MINFFSYLFLLLIPLLIILIVRLKRRRRVVYSHTFLRSFTDEKLLDYYFIPFSMFTVRIYYNKDLYREILKRDDPPTSYADFMDVCAKIKAYGEETGQPLVPLAASKAQGSSGLSR